MNRLISETSPYLRQHADNPVDWYPWGPEAFAEARARHLPVLLSVGYSTCHWCHVMAHESFEDAAVAAYINEHFVSIKVDREERPDIDALYMSAVQAMTGQGGWPMTVFLTPEGEPFYAGTYFPPRDMQGLPSFGRLLQSISHSWQTQPDKLRLNASVLTDYLREQEGAARDTASRETGAGETGSGETADPLAVLNPQRATENIQRLFDERYGGFGRAPKFPAPTALAFLLTQPQGRDMALFTLRQMALGGIHDQLGGGFHRYSVDERWLVPHFEKMLYDNAQLARVYLQAFQLSADPFYLDVARRTLGYLEREMLSPEGGFYSAQDADQAGIEGQYFVWTPAELSALLGPDAPLAITYWGVDEAGNFADPHHPEFGRRSVLSVVSSPAELAAQFGLSEGEVTARLEAARLTLLTARHSRPHPGQDDKILTSWNGLALWAFADAARITGEAQYLNIARHNAELILGHVQDSAGGLYHVATRQEGTVSGGKVTGLLEDSALYGLGLLALYQAGGEVSHLTKARELWQWVHQHFYNAEQGFFYSTGAGAEALLTRQVQAFDSAVLSDNAAAALLGAWMSRYFAAETEGQQAAERVLQTYGPQMLAAPTGFGGLWQVAALLAAPLSELAIVGQAEARRPLEQEAARHFLPFTVLASATPQQTNLLGDETALPDVLHGRLNPENPLAASSPALAYVCRARVCQLPVAKAAALGEQLAALTE